MLSDAYKNLESKAIPERLRLGKIHFTGVEGGGFRIVGYSGFDPLLMPEKLTRTLKYFDGKPQGVAASTRFDPQAKGLGEWASSRYVNIPEELL